MLRKLLLCRRWLQNIPYQFSAPQRFAVCVGLLLFLAIIYLSVINGWIPNVIEPMPIVAIFILLVIWTWFLENKLFLYALLGVLGVIILSFMVALICLPRVLGESPLGDYWVIPSFMFALFVAAIHMAIVLECSIAKLVNTAITATLSVLMSTINSIELLIIPQQRSELFVPFIVTQYSAEAEIIRFISGCTVKILSLIIATWGIVYFAIEYMAYLERRFK